MKPLTIEELRILDVGDWIWVINKKWHFSTYMRKSISSNDEYLCFADIVKVIAIRILIMAQNGLPIKIKNKPKPIAVLPS